MAERDQGLYMCVAENNVGKTETAASLQIFQGSQIILTKSSDFIIYAASILMELLSQEPKLVLRLILLFCGDSHPL